MPFLAALAGLIFSNILLTSACGPSTTPGALGLVRPVISNISATGAVVIDVSTNALFAASVARVGAATSLIC